MCVLIIIIIPVCVHSLRKASERVDRIASFPKLLKHLSHTEKRPRNEAIHLGANSVNNGYC